MRWILPVITIAVCCVLECSPFPISLRGKRGVYFPGGAAEAESAESSLGLSQVERQELLTYLQEKGYIPQDAPPTDDVIRYGIQQFQQFVNSPQTGELDDHTVSLIKSSRCGVPDIIALQYPLFWARWNKRHITYRISECQPSIDRNRLSEIVAAAMQMWMEVTPLSLCEATEDDDEADINIRNVEGDHGDGIAFDGPGGAVGHAFLPVSGEVHMDAGETWSYSRDAIGHDNGTNYLRVVTHQIGHSLGLLHSGDHGSVMYPFYPFYESEAGVDIRLSDDDIRRIQTIYGNTANSETTSPEERCQSVRRNH